MAGRDGFWRAMAGWSQTTQCEAAGEPGGSPSASAALEVLAFLMREILFVQLLTLFKLDAEVVAASRSSASAAASAERPRTRRIYSHTRALRKQDSGASP